MERSIQEVAASAGVTTRTLRYYDHIGLVTPDRNASGYRFYDDRALVRLQRVLLLRRLGLKLDAIAQVLEVQDQRAVRDQPDSLGVTAEQAEASILSNHLELLRRERDSIETQIAAVERTIAALSRNAEHNSQGNKEREDLMSQNMFEGFDHTHYREEVEQRWGAEAYAKSDQWWQALGAEGQSEWQTETAALNVDWAAAAERGYDPESAVAQDLARRHVAWLSAIPGTPASASGGDLAGYLLGLGEMYVADERFAVNYGGVEGAIFVRDTLAAYVKRELGSASP